METLEELKAKHAREIAELEREHEILALLPVKPDRVMFHSGKPHIYHKAETLAEAVAILDSYETEPFVQLDGTFLHHKPLDWISERDQDSAKSVTDCAGALLTIGGGRGFGPDAKITKWARLQNGTTAEVQVSLGVYPCGEGFPARWRVQSRVIYDLHGNVTKAEHTPPTIVADLPMAKWGTGSPDSYRFSWVWCEQETFHNEMARFIEAKAA